uniref:ATP synthase complex subunit 8 n=1 Tax=Staphylinidae sp. 2 EF-2015 TaxID=1759563 RepID=A0A0S2M7D9_9COLE|nr:ATP synthase F0 subunit 8 [Staphylinidae sp. 2 EF-2015]
MPQMAPLNWMTLFIYFIILFLIMNSMNYFSYNTMINKKSNKFFMKNYFWKW